MVPISVQLYSVRDAMAADAMGTLKQIAEMGYAGVEPAGFGDLSAADFRKAVEDLGMTVSSSHGPDVMSDFDGAVAAAKDLGIDMVSHMGFGGKTTLDELKAAAADINVVCDKLAAVGMTMFMHNHNGEFEAQFDGRSLFDTLFEMCPKLQTETDIYWVQVGGADPAAVISQYKSRMPLMHVKDGPISPASPMSPVGQGKVDIAGCLKAAEGGALTWAVVELDEAEGDMLDAVAQSIDFLTSNGLGTGK